jgi:predicted metal-dependent hydrolase
MTTQNCELEDDKEEEGESDEGETRELPDYFQELYQLAVAKIEDPQEGHLIKRLLIDYQDIFLKPGDTLQVAKVG